ncbi:FAD-dependent oxidoreductase [Subtercola lobariae]|uniref:Oxidoreductase n=1 Tax=Subtercola lobariae TaxID=1588641 RepID=A0A917EVH3_9MICO|nr:FAD-dependent oxidoreductase [Subtercola lobariae]GGF20528.1 oxidoreductase [Subtercola lobariae]
MPESEPGGEHPLPAAARVVVIGAGQAGLSVAYQLQRRGLRAGVDLVIVDRGPGAGGAWQFRWESLRLGTAHQVSDLPAMRDLGISFETADQSGAARDVVAEYYERYEEHFGLRVYRPVEVISVRELAEGGDLGVTTSLGELRTEIVVNASGTWATPFRPLYRGAETFRGVQIGTPQYRSAQDYAGKRVVIVGGGTSAVGFVLELEGVAASTVWVTRRTVLFAEEDGATVSASLESRLAAVNRQDEAASAGRVLPSISSGTGLPGTAKNLAAVERGVLIARPMFDSIEPDGVRFADGTFEPADVIIWATGFRSELAHLEPLNLREQSGGIRVENGRVARNGRVFLAGYGPQASTIGANRAGRLVAMQVLDALRRLEHPQPEAD